MSACVDCEARPDDFGAPSTARWVGPDGEGYCSMHFVHRFGHQEKLVRIDGFEPPRTIKPPAPRATTRR